MSHVCLFVSSVLFSEGLSKKKKKNLKEKKTLPNVFMNILACILCTHLIFSPGHTEQRIRKRELSRSLVPADQQPISGVKGRVPTKPDWLVPSGQTWKYSCSDVEGVEHVRTQGREGARRWEDTTAAAHHSPIPT